MKLATFIGLALAAVAVFADTGTPSGPLLAQQRGSSPSTMTAAQLKETELKVTGRAAGILGSGRVSPDGRYISFSDEAIEGGTGNLALWDVQAGTTTIVTKDSNLQPYADGRAEASAWSPGGTRLAYAWRIAGSGGRKRELRIVDRRTGRHQVVFQTPDALPFLTPFAFSPDEQHVLASLAAPAGAGTIGAAELVLISIADGAKRTLKTFDGSEPGGALFSPDGKYVAYDFLPHKDSAARDLCVMNIDTGHEQMLTTEPATNDILLGWLADGHVLFRSDREGSMDAWAIRVRNGAPQSAPVLVKRAAGQIQPQGITEDGRVFLWKSIAVREVYVAELDPATGKAVRPAVPLAGTEPFLKRSEPAWSPDGSRIAYVQVAPAMTPRVVVQTVATNDRRAYPAPVRNIDWMLWTPDEQSVFIDGTGQDNVQRMFKLDLASGRVEPASEARRVIIGVSPDGRFVFEIGAGLGIARRSLVDDTSVTLGPNPGNGTALSPDGHWVAYIGRGTRGEVPLAIRPVAGGAETVLVEKFSPGYARITWSRDSRFIVFNNNPAGLHRVSIDGGPPVSLGITGLGSIMEKSMNADGRRLAFGVNRDSTELWVWENVLTQGRRP